MEMQQVTDRKNQIQTKALGFALMEMNAGAGEEGENNSGPFVHKYLNELAEPPANWCSAFICWCMNEACKCLDIDLPFEYTLSAKKLFNIYKKNGWLVDHPQEADIIFFWRDNPLSWMGHVGIVKTVYIEEIAEKSWRNRIITIEGNKGFFPAHVAEYRYDTSNVPKLLGYGRIK